MTSWKLPWHCAICDDEFTPGSDGGSCGRCGQAVCKKHLAIVAVVGRDHPDEEEIVCETCLIPGEQTRPVRRRHYLRLFNKNNPKKSDDR